jgi:hypothetical protein
MMSNAVSGNTELLRTIYAGVAVTADIPATWDDVREAKRIEQEKRLEIWGDELRTSQVGQLILACNGLLSGRGSCQGQHDDGFALQPSEHNVLSLHYLNPPRTTWVGELISADLRFSEDGDEIWGVKVLDGIRKEPQIIGGFDHGFRNVGVYEQNKFSNEEDAYQFLVNYIQTHDCAQTLREVIGRNVRLEEQRKAQAEALTLEA